MTTDRELLELAAKAIGVTLYISVSRYTKTTKYFSRKDGFQKPWNPLEDDGDALQTAVKLGLHVSPFPAGARVRFQNHILDTCEVEEHGNPYAATRRAIVRAAAEIGRSMK